MMPAKEIRPHMRCVIDRNTEETTITFFSARPTQGQETFFKWGNEEIKKGHFLDLNCEINDNGFVSLFPVLHPYEEFSRHNDDDSESNDTKSVQRIFYEIFIEDDVFYLLCWDTIFNQIYLPEGKKALVILESEQTKFEISVASRELEKSERLTGKLPILPGLNSINQIESLLGKKVIAYFN